MRYRLYGFYAAMSSQSAPGGDKGDEATSSVSLESLAFAVGRMNTFIFTAKLANLIEMVEATSIGAALHSWSLQRIDLLSFLLLFFVSDELRKRQSQNYGSNRMFTNSIHFYV
jgi:hypothetical protein